MNRGCARHHAPRHRLLERGAYIVTAGIYQKQHLLRAARRLDLVRNTLFACAEEFPWERQAWAILSNHYPFVASSLADPSTLTRLISKFHTLTARKLNQWQMREGIKTDRVNVADAFEPFSPEYDADRAASSRRTPQEEQTS